MQNEYKYYPLTYPQKAIWYTEKLYPGTSIGNIAGTLRIKENINIEVLEKAINLFIETNDSMRLRITEIDGEPKQYISKYRYRRLDFYDFSDKDINDLYKWDQIQTKTPFKLTEDDLYYFAIIKVNDNDTGFFVKCHHLIADGWSMSLLGSRIVNYYSRLKNGNDTSDINNPSYLDYIAGENNYLDSKRFSKDGNYWNEVFETMPDKTFLKANIPDAAGIKARRKTMLTPKKLTVKINKYCVENRTSVFSLFAAALSMYINRVTSKEDIVLGTTTLNRLNAVEKATTGMFNNITPMRIGISDDMDFKSLIEGVSREGLRLLRHQKYPYECLLKQVRENHKIFDNLFSIVLIYQNSKFVKENIEEQYKTRWHFNGCQAEPLHISINDRETEGHFIIDYDYQTEIFHAKEIDFIHQNIINILWHALDNPAKRISRLEMLSEREKHKVLNEFKRTRIIYPKGYRHIYESFGKKIPEKTKSYILDKNLNPMPIGVSGDLYFSGASLTERKLKSLALSRDMAIPNPYTSEDLLYKSKMTARWFPDGDLLYIGDADISEFAEKEKAFSGKENITADIVSTFVAEPVKEYIKFWGEKFGFDITINFAGYNQIFQELLKPGSMMAENTGGINIAFIRLEDFLRDDKGTDEEKISLLNKAYCDLKDAFGSFGSSIPWIVAVFPVSTHSSFSDDVKQSMSAINEEFTKILSLRQNVFLIDIDRLQGLYGISDAFDLLADKEAHMPFTDEYYAAIGTETARKICALKRQHYKIIVLDCDNTLWKGICGESGAQGVRVTEPYRLLQQFMCQKFKEGMLIAVCSKNNENDVFEVFEKNAGMVLNRNHIINWKVNWVEKAVNIREIARELGIGLDSFIFIDDDPLECSKMAENCPEVLTLKLPPDEKHIPIFLNHVWALDKAGITEEDAARNRMYQQEKKRKELKSKGISLESFLKSLDLKVCMRFAGQDDIIRASQLTQRTNQFNLNKKIRDENEIASLLNDEKTACFVVEASDRFGDYGIIGLIILKDDSEKLFVDTFLMSCRIFGRNVEDMLLAGIGTYAQEIGRYRIEAAFVPTAKNKPTADFIKRTRWKLAEETDKYQLYNINAVVLPEKISHIEFYYRHRFEKIAEDQTAAKDQSAAADGVLLQTDRVLYNMSCSSSLNDSIFDFYDTDIISNVNNKEYIEPLNYLTGKKLLQIAAISDIGGSAAETGDFAGETQRKLAAIWKSILRITSIGKDSDFFKLGGDSLSAVILISRINNETGVELTLRDVFNHSALAKMAQKIDELGAGYYERIVPVGDSEYYGLSSAQKRMYILNKIESDPTVYNECHRIQIEGKLDRFRLEAAFQRFIQRHEVMRSGFEMLDEGPVQRIYESIDFAVSYFRARAMDIDKLTREFIRPFDLSKPPLIRVALIETGKEKYALLLDIHHIIADGASFGIMIREVKALYEGRELDPPDFQYKDFVNWQNEFLKSAKIDKQEQYWVERFKGEIPILNMPTNHLRPPVQSFRGKRRYFNLNEGDTRGMKALCNSTGTTLFMLLFAAFNILLHRYTGQEDIVVGIPVSGRRHIDTRDIMGMFVNTLPIRTYPKSDCSFADYLQQVKEAILMGLENQDFQYENLIDKLNVPRELNRNPLFDVLFSLRNTDMPELDISGLTLYLCGVDSNKSKFDISLLVSEKDRGLEFCLEYCSDLFEDDFIMRLQQHYLNILNEVIVNPQKGISDIEILSDAEKHRILYEFNDTKADYPKDKTIHQLFEEQAERTPDKVAVVFEDEELTYSELNAKANQLAGILRDNGVKPDTIVAIMVERSLEMIIGIMAILKAGGAYLPIDPEYPQERIRYMLEDSGAKILLTQRSLADGVSITGDVLFIDDRILYENDCSNLVNNNNPNDMIYLIYTSGSTGRPKGVMLEHRNISNLVYFQFSKTCIDFKLNVMQFASMSFDVCAQEIFSTLLGGGTLYIISGENKNNIRNMYNFIKTKDINIVFLPTAFFKLLISKKDYITIVPDNIQHIIVAGEKLVLSSTGKEYVKKCYNKLHNHYGPAETHVVTTYTIDKANVQGIPSIGRPISNTQIFILNKNDKIQPVGVYGEICISGESVGRGYINNGDLTSQKYALIEIDNKKVRCYKSGDIGRWNTNGDIEYYGRDDNQVKIKGYRVEIGEIENSILKYNGIKECVVITKNITGENLDLVAYYTSDINIVVDDLKAFLKKSLPLFMVPKYYSQIERIRLTNNGKMDKSSLPLIHIAKNQKPEYLYTKNERALLDIWKTVLNADGLSVNDNFFENGGDSLLLIKLLFEIEKKGYNLCIKDIYMHPSVKEICKYIGGTDD